MVTKRTLLLILLTLMALASVGMILIIAASAVPASPIVDLQKSSQISADDILVTQTAAQLNIQNPKISIVADTRSMEPALYAGNHVLEKVPQFPSQITVGDIITYKSLKKQVTIVHRVVEIGTDDYGWFVKTKGDNSQVIDDELIRFSQVRGIVVAVIY